MEKQSSPSIHPGAAREQLRAARRAHDAAVRRAVAPAGLILALSAFCGTQTVPASQRGPAGAATGVAIVWCLAEVLRMAARNGWRPLLSWPRPQWSATEVALTSVAVLVGGVVGPHLLAANGNSAPLSWALGAAVAAFVAACLFAARASYRRRDARTWQP